jgi:hypothetical protein
LPETPRNVAIPRGSPPLWPRAGAGPGPEGPGRGRNVAIPRVCRQAHFGDPRKRTFGSYDHEKAGRRLLSVRIMKFLDRRVQREQMDKGVTRSTAGKLLEPMILGTGGRSDPGPSALWPFLPETPRNVAIARGLPPGPPASAAGASALPAGDQGPRFAAVPSEMECRWGHTAPQGVQGAAQECRRCRAPSARGSGKKVPVGKGRRSVKFARHFKKT